VVVERDQPASVSQLAEIGASWMRNAMEAGAGHLAADGLARHQGPSIVPQRDLLATLRRRELDAVAAGLRFAMVDHGLGFALVIMDAGARSVSRPACRRRRRGRDRLVFRTRARDGDLKRALTFDEPHRKQRSRADQLPAASMVALAIDRPKIAITVVFSMERLGVSINIAHISAPTEIALQNLGI
jgi:hypothetical protein